MSLARVSKRRPRHRAAPALALLLLFSFGVDAGCNLAAAPEELADPPASDLISNQTQSQPDSTSGASSGSDDSDQNDAGGAGSTTGEASDSGSGGSGGNDNAADDNNDATADSGSTNGNSNDNTGDHTPPKGDKFKLWSNGANLRGANIYQRRVYPEADGPNFLGPGPVGPPFTQDDINRLAATGANYVNISHPGIFTIDPPYVVDEGVQANLDNLLKMIAHADMFAVISFRSGPGRSEFALFVGQDWFPQSLVNDKVWTESAAQDAWIEMWKYTAARYKDNAVIVGYDLMVEPNSNHVFFNNFDAADFSATYAGSTYDWNQLHPRITAGIRTIDADTPILVSPMSYGSVYWLPYLTLNGDPRTVYTVHSYEPFIYTHQDPPNLALSYPGVFDADGDGVNDNVNFDWQHAFLQTVADWGRDKGVPVACNEYGVKRWQHGAAMYTSDEVAVFDEFGMSTAYWIFGASWAPAIAVDDFDFTHGPDPAKHTILADSDLQTVLKAYLGKNVYRPSTWPPAVGN